MIYEKFTIIISPKVLNLILGPQYSFEMPQTINTPVIFLGVGEYLENLCIAGFEKMRTKKKSKTHSVLHTNGNHTVYFNFRGKAMILELLEHEKTISLSSMTER